MEQKKNFKEKVAALSKNRKITLIVGLLLLLIAIVVGVIFIIAGTKKNPEKENQLSTEQDVSNNQNQTDNDSHEETDDNTEDNTDENGGIIIEDESNSGEETEDNPDGENQGEQEDPFDEEIKDIMDETTQGQEVVELTQTEIDYINNEIFKNVEEAYFPNMFLLCYFKTLEEIDMGELFYNGLGFDERYELTEEESNALRALGEDYFTGPTKLPEERIDEILKKYTGQGIEFFRDQLNESFYYLEEYKSYYTWAGDVSFMYHEMESGYRTSDGYTVLFYRYDSGVDSWICKVTVKENEDRSFQFVSNEMYGLTFIDYTNRREAVADYEAYGYIAKVESVDWDGKKISLQTYTAAETNRGPIYAALTESDIVELELAENVEIIVEAGIFEAYYLDPFVMERLQDSPCFCDKEFFVIIKDGKVVKMIDRIGLRIWL